jgi:GntR family transcriptional regulator
MEDKRPSIYFRLDSRSGVAPYRQLVDQVRHAVKLGQLRGGDQLPSVRDVVTQVTINPNTVHRAYRELEHLGIAEGRLGLGTFITHDVDSLSRESDHDVVEESLKQWIKLARRSGLDEDQMLTLLRQFLHHNEQVRS